MSELRKLSGAATSKLSNSLCECRVVNGYHEYVILTKLKHNPEPKSVAHRYTTFLELRKLLCLEWPCCIVPPIPPKSSLAKLMSAES